MLIFLQHFAAKLGIVTGHSLAANIRTKLPKPAVWIAGVTIILACTATDLAEYLGAALGFYLLFGLPLWLGAPLTVGIVFVAILGQQYHRLERMIVVFLAIIAACYIIELYLVHPDWAAAAPKWVIPSVDGASILVALAMLGAIVMPHNIYLHSNVILSRDWDSLGSVADHVRHNTDVPLLLLKSRAKTRRAPLRMPDGQNYVGGAFHLAGENQPLSRRTHGCLSKPRGRRPGTREPSSGYRCL
jgi:NRAMP (natural resistance-associated macrophage protein)-like metal ion transporter